MRIIFVDDDPDTRTLAIRSVLQEFPHAKVAEASDLPSLEAVIRSGPVDVLVSDFDLQWNDGFQVLDLARRDHPESITVMFTGTGNEELAVRALKAGFDDYVVKAPGQLKRLAQSLRSAVERREERRLLRDNRDLLRQELYHRLHNNLQIVISLMRLTMKAVDDPAAKTQVGDMMHRIRTLSILQEQIYRADDLRNVDVGAFILSIAHDLTERSFDESVEAIRVQVDRAVPIGLIANELIMEALASADGNVESLRLSLRRHDDSVELKVSPTRSKSHASAEGLGFDLIRRLAAQIDGVVTQEPRESITRVSFHE